MGLITRQFTSWAEDTATASYTVDDVAHLVVSVQWDNPSGEGQLLFPGLNMGTLASDVGPGEVTELELAHGIGVPLTVGQPLTLEDNDGNAGAFTVAAPVTVGDTVIPVNPVTLDVAISAAAGPMAPLPTIPAPASGDTATLPDFYGGGSVGSTDSVDFTPLGIPSRTQTGLHGVQEVFPGGIGAGGV